MQHTHGCRESTRGAKLKAKGGRGRGKEHALRPRDWRNRIYGS